jgi:hypothetical protein
MTSDYHTGPCGTRHGIWQWRQTAKILAFLKLIFYLEGWGQTIFKMYGKSDSEKHHRKKVIKPEWS